MDVNNGSCFKSRTQLSDSPQHITEKTNGVAAQNGYHDTLETEHPLVAVLQFTAIADKDANVETCNELIRQAKKCGAQMVFLPEGFDYICSNAVDSIKSAEPIDGPVLTNYRNIARELRIHLSLGGYHLQDPIENRAHNSHIVINDQGEIAAIYRKTHLCKVDITGRMTIDESLYCIPGAAIIPPVSTPAGKLGLMCCYDLRFPELAALLTRQGAELLAYPAAFNVVTGVAHWEALLRARAIENQCFVIAAAQYGAHHEKRFSFGNSMIIDPWGVVLARCADGAGIALAEIDLGKLRRVRDDMPLQSHRRHDLYHLSMSPVELEEFSSSDYDFGSQLIPQSQVFHETLLSLAFVNSRPIRKGHILVIPKRPVQKFSALTPNEVADLFHVVRIIEGMLIKALDVPATTMLIKLDPENDQFQDGIDAGQSVKHVHVHVIPRTPSDNERHSNMPLEEEYTIIQSLPARTAEDMASEASQYRQILKVKCLQSSEIPKLKERVVNTLHFVHHRGCC